MGGGSGTTGTTGTWVDETDIRPLGEFGTATPAGGDRCDREQQPGDASYLRTDKALSALKRARDRLAGEIKGELDAAAFSGTGVHDAAGQTLACRALISSAERLAAGH